MAPAIPFALSFSWLGGSLFFLWGSRGSFTSLTSLTSLASFTSFSFWVALSDLSGSEDTELTKETSLLEHFSGFIVDGDLLEINDGLLGDEVKSSLSFFFLDLQGNTSDGSLLDSLHQVSSKSCNLVTESLGRDLSDFGEDLLVEVEVVGELAEVMLDESLSGSLDCFSSDSTHFAWKF